MPHQGAGRESRDDEEVSRAGLKMMEYIRKIKTLGLLVFERL